MNLSVNKKLQEYTELLGTTFLPFLNQNEEEFLSRIANLDPANREKVLQFKDWDWFQGVGLYGLWNYYRVTKNTEYLDILTGYFKKNMERGLPGKNINSTAPMLTLACLYGENPCEPYRLLIEEWADWVRNGLPKTEEGGFQHITSERDNTGQLWDDTLFMTVLFLAKAGAVLKKEDDIEEALYQFLVHIKYLTDRRTGLWYHGWTFEGNHNYGKALWARGNCWITLAIPELFEILSQDGNGDKQGQNRQSPQYGRNSACLRFLAEAYRRQAEALVKCQSPSGMWHTVLNDEDSYPEASGTAGIACGILKGVRMGLLGKEYLEAGLKPLEALLQCMDKDGTVHQVSIGTPLGADAEFYKKIPQAPMAYGQALMLLYLLEVQQAGVTVQSTPK